MSSRWVVVAFPVDDDVDAYDIAAVVAEYAACEDNCAVPGKVHSTVLGEAPEWVDEEDE